MKTGNMKTGNCAICGAKFQIMPHGTNKRYCSDACRRKAHKESAKNRREARKPPSLTHFLTVAECELCKTCVYLYRTQGAGLRSCDYIIDTGEPRGCDVSEHCKRYERKGERNG